MRSKRLFEPASAPPVRSKWPFWPAPVPPVRSKRLFEPASAPPVRSKWPLWPALVLPVRSKRLFEHASAPPERSALEVAARACFGNASAFEPAVPFEKAVRDHCSKVLVSVTLCSVPLYSAPLSPCMDMHGFTLVYIYIYNYIYIYMGDSVNRRIDFFVFVNVGGPPPTKSRQSAVNR